MKIAIIGYGKMGHVIEQIAKERGNEVVLILDALINPQDFTAENLRKADVAIEFTRPDAAFADSKLVEIFFEIIVLDFEVKHKSFVLIGNAVEHKTLELP